MRETKYKWSSAAEWLLDQIENEWTPEQVQQCARELLQKVDNDTIQDLYQDDMSNDGFFEPLPPEPDISTMTTLCVQGSHEDCDGMYGETACGCNCHTSEEPSIDDSVLFCPDCETPNQFGELCPRCERDRSER
jgi:hypothetical protein